ncbi:MAG: NAD(P)H-dependent oxidoreductase [Chitinophagales bacterium]
MTKKILAFGASSSRASINKKFATFAAHQIEGAEVNLLDLNDFEVPIYSMDKEMATGFPELIKQFKQHILDADGLIISFAEHNGAYSAAFKNIMDWVSRMEGSTWADKPMFLMATSPGGRGGATVLDIAVNKFQFMGKGAITSFSLPFFGKNFSETEGITDEQLAQTFEEKLKMFVKSL